MTFAFFLLFQGGFGALAAQLVPFIAIFAIFYFLVIMPQRRRQQELQATISAIKAGDRIVTNGGILATVTVVKDKSLLIRSADKSILEISRSAVAGLQQEEEKKGI
ncbi:MAG: preprotein translocase subunit YajC [Pyrinomonadaceae bacterium]|nr:preprotein translocase subunit YajC [Pyrinomonadaceae bacterium]MDQ3135355.1 preprotein translocase subunit YajC [Acidobacteriota bacterium]